MTFFLPLSHINEQYIIQAMIKETNTMKVSWETECIFNNNQKYLNPYTLLQVNKNYPTNSIQKLLCSVKSLHEF